MQSKKLKIFISMPFTGKKFEDLYQERLDLKALVESYGFELTEQFVGYQFKEDFESKDYDPKWVVGKDKNWLKQSDVVISDFRTYSIGTDFELMLCKEVFNKRVYAVVPEERRFHPWLKFYCERYFDSVEDALKQIKKDYPNGPKYSPVDKRQYDSIAGEYRMVEETPAQNYIYDPALKNQLKDVVGKKVAVLHSGSGYRARMAKDLGADDVLGTDISYQEIRIAEDVEFANPKGIQYVITDVYTDDFTKTIPSEYIGQTDIVVGYFALDHAMDKKELEVIAKNVNVLLKDGGQFVGMSDNPESNISLPNKYGVVLGYDDKNIGRSEGEPRRVSIFKNGKEVMHFHNFVWSKDTLKDILKSVGFTEVSVQHAVVDQEGIEKYGADFWKEYVDMPDQVLIFAKK